MKTIALTQNKVALVDDEDFEALSTHRWFAIKNNGSFYAARNVRGVDGKKRLVRMHQQLMPTEPRVDHKDRDGLNNQRDNLRPATCTQNNANTRRSRANTSGEKGVYFETRSSKWVAQVYVGGVLRRGRFAEKSVAVEQAKAWRRELHEDFACDG